jgi:hypothetical protein
MLVEPQTHPRTSSVCGALSGKPSCCSDQTLTDLTRWADAIDEYTAASKYIKWYIESDPRALVDLILVWTRAATADTSVDWAGIRNQTRDDWGVVLKSLVDSMTTPADKLWTDVVTYQEGLLCSACVPDFSPNYLNLEARTLTLRPEAADAVASSFLDLLHIWDLWWAEGANINHIMNAGVRTCWLATKSVSCRVLVPTTINLAVPYLTKNSLRIMLCGAPADAGQEDSKCRDTLNFQVLHGLSLDPTPILYNLLNKAADLCKMSPKNCSPQIDLARKQIDLWFFTFDQRPVLQNVYSDGGFDVMAQACASHLSGYACGGAGPPLPDHSADAPGQASGAGGGNVGLIVGVVLLLGLAGLAAAMFVMRHRLRHAAQSMYSRMRDDRLDGSNSGPLVGLV